MANVTIITTTNTIEVDFGVYADDLAISKGVWRKSSVIYINLNDNHIYLKIRDGNEWVLNYSTQSKGFIVDTIDGVAPTSLSDLYDKLKVLIA